jgi:hypothetical protein
MVLRSIAGPTLSAVCHPSLVMVKGSPLRVRSNEWLMDWGCSELMSSKNVDNWDSKPDLLMNGPNQ